MPQAYVELCELIVLLSTFSIFLCIYGVTLMKQNKTISNKNIETNE